MITEQNLLYILDRAEEKTIEDLKKELSWEAMAPKGDIRHALDLFSYYAYEELEREL